mmetsp:Transcript_53338/g.88467  ORF Transcript_53338/g.88467 Transcript_53338/m.88467 type:complete len:104 (+) Transcript_53338:127-438(+)
MEDNHVRVIVVVVVADLKMRCGMQQLLLFEHQCLEHCAEASIFPSLQLLAVVKVKESKLEKRDDPFFSTTTQTKNASESDDYLVRVLPWTTTTMSFCNDDWHS